MLDYKFFFLEIKHLLYYIIMLVDLFKLINKKLMSRNQIKQLDIELNWEKAMEEKTCSQLEL
jgi:hypothetical protein